VFLALLMKIAQMEANATQTLNVVNVHVNGVVAIANTVHQDLFAQIHMKTVQIMEPAISELGSVFVPMGSTDLLAVYQRAPQSYV